MSDIRTLLETFKRLDEAQKHKFLDAIVDKYAKEDMDIGDYEKMFADAAKAEYDGNLGAFGRALMTKDFKTKYVLAHAAKKIGLPGLYKPNGSFVKLDDEGEPQSSRGGSKKQAIAVGKRGLLPEKLRKKFAERFPEEDAFTKKSSTKDIDAMGAAAAGVDTDDKKDSVTPSKPKKIKFADLDKAQADKLSQQKLKRLLQLIDTLEESRDLNHFLGRLLNDSKLMERDLTDAELQELRSLVSDLKDLSQNKNLSNVNRRMINAQIDRVPSNLLAKAEPKPAADDDSQASPAGDYRPPKFEPEPVSKKEPKSSNNDGPDGVKVTLYPQGEEPDSVKGATKQSTAGSLKAFAKSGKGGLANDPDETNAITELQMELQARGFDPRGVDGKYGPGTIAAVKSFQKSAGLKVDGDAGPATIKALLDGGQKSKSSKTQGMDPLGLMKPKKGSSQPPQQSSTTQTAKPGPKKVSARPAGRMGAAWDKKYASSHNRDGSPKATESFDPGIGLEFKSELAKKLWGK